MIKTEKEVEGNYSETWIVVEEDALDEAFRMALTGEIADGLAIVGLTRAYHYLQSNRGFEPIERCFKGFGCPLTPSP